MANTKIQTSFKEAIIALNTNIDTITKSGVYYVGGTDANLPEGSNGYLIVLSNVSYGSKQIFTRYGTSGSNDGNIYIRNMTGAKAWWKFTGTLLT